MSSKEESAAGVAAPNDYTGNNGLSSVLSVADELKQRNQWLLWRLEKRPDRAKPVKLPVGLDGLTIDATTAGMSFQAVCGALAAHPDRFSGIGYSFQQGDPFIGYDLDGVLNEDGEIIDPEIREEVRLLDSYTEISPSGTGLHIIVRGRRRPGMKIGKRRGCRELYFSGRYFTITGDLWQDAPNTIREIEPDLLAEIYLKVDLPEKRQPAPAPRPHTMTGLSDSEIITRLVSIPTRARLFYGDVSGYPSQSEADLAACNMIAFYADGAGQIDSVFRSSGLYRSKWERRDYREATIQKAISGIANHYDDGVAHGAKVAEAIIKGRGGPV